MMFAKPFELTKKGDFYGMWIILLKKEMYTEGIGTMTADFNRI